MGYVLRKAAPSDFEALYALNMEAFRQHVEAIWGWDEAFQRANFKRRFGQGLTDAIEVGGRVAGFLKAERNPTGIKLDTLVLAPEFRSAGIGTQIIRGLVEEAEAANLPLTLQVLKPNVRARALYERLGFATTGETETHFLMCWRPRTP